MISSATIYTLISGGLAENLRNKGVEEEIAGIEKVKDFQLSLNIAMASVAWKLGTRNKDEEFNAVILRENTFAELWNSHRLLRRLSLLQHYFSMILL